MLTIKISQEVIEAKIRSLAQAHHRNVEDIVVGALATSLGNPEILSDLHFPLPFEIDEYASVPVMA